MKWRVLQISTSSTTSISTPWIWRSSENNRWIMTWKWMDPMTDTGHQCNRYLVVVMILTSSRTRSSHSRWLTTTVKMHSCPWTIPTNHPINRRGRESNPTIEWWVSHWTTLEEHTQEATEGILIVEAGAAEDCNPTIPDQVVRWIPRWQVKLASTTTSTNEHYDDYSKKPKVRMCIL